MWDIQNLPASCGPDGLDSAVFEASAALPTEYAQVPPWIIGSRRWLVHRAKRPFYVDGFPRCGTLDTPQDTDRFATFGRALATVLAGGFDGLGFALGSDGTGNHWQGIDLDKIEVNGLQDLAAALPGYVEWSPSGLGIHAIGYGAPFPALKLNGIEAYCAGRFFTFTGRRIR